ncbi:YktB family protein [Ornithinibacillus californiensis]|uniref:YktB family protein n=1 Tax=Ornithinibacillus californiensis TaxID=161536 RepID=UPI00064DD674|nr:DUF1054 domain-containing protein [Ornithinibacillus californiensis]
MSIKGFVKSDFDTFQIEGLDARMEAIQKRIQPKFNEIGQELVDFLSAQLGNEVYLHIAKHARRTVNPPKDTWLAISHNNRGYKKHPHFQVGLFDDHLFIWLACIYELDSKTDIAKNFLANYNKLKQLPADFVVSLDHMKKDSFALKDLEKSHLERFRDVKKGEFLIGRHVTPEDPVVSNGEQLLKLIKDTYQHLIPFYRIALQS